MLENMDGKNEGNVVTPRFQLYTHIGYLFIVYEPFVYICMLYAWDYDVR